jgi:hypothetical protein
MISFKIREIIIRFLIIFALMITLIGCTDKQIACTSDAKICPDGSAVGRDSSNGCEFFPCTEEEMTIEIIEESEELSREECEAEGGEWGTFGRLGLKCNLPTIDAGIPCKDNSDCETLCLVDEKDIGTNDIESGRCSDWKLNFGCMHVMELGKPVELCID